MLTVVPSGFTPEGDVAESSTGFVDSGGESHAIQRFTDPAGRWIEFDSFGAESPSAHITQLNADVATESVKYDRCLDVETGPTRVEYSITVARDADRTILGAQEWEYGGITLAGHPNVTVDDLIAMASGLRRRTG